MLKIKTIFKIIFSKLGSSDAKEAFSKFNISNKYERIYHYHIRKTGGTSINRAIMNYLYSDSENTYSELASKWINTRVIYNNRITVGWNKALLEQGYYHFGFSHIPQHEIVLPKDTFTFTILRDPIERIYSHYNMLKYYSENNIAHPVRQNEENWLGNNIIDFVNQMPKSHLRRQLYMFSNHYDVEEALSNLQKINRIFFTSDLARAIGILSDGFKFNLKIRHDKKSSRSKKLSHDENKIITNLLKNEIIFYETAKNKYYEVY